MSKWIRGRLGRPIASMISVLMLVSLLLPLTIPPVQAQVIDPNQLAEFFGLSISKPTQIVVLDFVNRSNYPTGMLGRTIADAVSIELTDTRTFEVIRRSEVERVMAEFNLSLPLSTQGQCMLADRLDSQYILSGNVGDVQIVKGRDGTFAEVAVGAAVLSRITQLPINGAQVVVRSSPKIGYSGNTDVLVHEALTIAAYQVTQKILDNRLPVGTVLHVPRDGEVVLRGGSTLGFKKGMVLTTMRFGQVTGRVRLTSINPQESHGEVLEDSRGIAAGDKGVPIFEYAYSPTAAREVREKAGLQIAALAMLGILATLVGTENGNKELDVKLQVPRVTAMADAAAYMESDGANLVSWPNYGGHVIAYIIYRDDNPNLPIAVVDGYTYQYRDGIPKDTMGNIYWLERIDYTITINPDTGRVEQFNGVFVRPNDNGEIDLGEAPPAVTGQTAVIQCSRMRPVPGQRYGYRLRVLYMEYEDQGLAADMSHPMSYELRLGNNSSPFSARVTTTQPPILLSPGAGSLLTDVFRCTPVPGAQEYTLQISVNDPTFAPSNLLNIRPIRPQIEGDTVVAWYSLQDLFNDLNLWLQYHPLIPQAPTLYWRMGARVVGDPLPQPFVNVNNAKDWVFSATNYFSSLQFPPSPPGLSLRKFNNEGAPLWNGKLPVYGRGDAERSPGTSAGRAGQRQHWLVR